VTTAEAGKTDTKNRSDENPSFLNASLTAKANTVLYDNLTLKDGKLIVKDEKLTMEGIKICFDGIIGLNGAISTKEKVPTFNMDLH
jgi:hypothetical protein